jgi:hypothetical protein
MLRIPIITLTLAMLGGALVGNTSIKPLAAQQALCSFGTTTPCQEIHTCTERAWSIGLKAWQFGIGSCLSWRVDKLYFAEHAMSGSQSGQDEENNDPGDESGDGEGDVN